MVSEKSNEILVQIYDKIIELKEDVSSIKETISTMENMGKSLEIRTNNLDLRLLETESFVSKTKFIGKTLCLCGGLIMAIATLIHYFLR